MPEGDTIYRTADTLRRALLGKRITSFHIGRRPLRAATSPHRGPPGA